MGTCPANGTDAVCCLSRSGSHEITGNFGRIYQQYGRSTSWFANKGAAVSNLPGGVTWEAFYYVDSYAYQLAYDQNASTAGGADGTITITLRANATVHTTPADLLAAAPGLFTAVTAADITAAFGPWNAAVQTHWTSQNHTVKLGAPDCPGDFPISFSVVEETNAGNAHQSFSVLNMTHPLRDPTTWNPIITNPAHAQYPMALRLAREARSNAAKFNLGDARGTLVFGHEYGHWMGWGDEYIEVSPGTIPHPTNPAGGQVVREIRGANNVSLRVALRIVNPTQTWQSANGSSQEDVDLAVAGRSNWLMADMNAPQSYPVRFVYTIVDDFIRMYNQDHYGGSSSAFCISVT